ncbi:hypothetical protein CHS0354_031369 [Potamilus streckersoni]|uniref:Uncharacterized protein n=1 Tax=Potamilus streckersoni TaxID=2493646 RepID=A0AAE0VX81_9BIVA|nr:hypothetical protein CHS0354_031369 [Potamilus streckersoni]
MSDHMTPEIKAGQFSIEEEQVNANSLTSDRNILENILIRETKANTFQQNTEENRNDHDIGSRDFDNGCIVSADHELDNIGVPDDHGNNTFPEDHDNNTILKDHSNDTFTEEYHNSTIPENNDNKTIPEDYDNNTIPEDYNNNIIPEDHVNNTVPEDHDNNTIPEDHDNNTIPENHDNNNVQKDHKNLYAYYVTDEEDFAFSFMKLFSSKGKKVKTKDKPTHQKVIKDKEKKPLIDQFKQTQRKLLNTKDEHGVITNHPYIQALSGGGICNSSVTGASTGTLKLSAKANLVNFSTGKRPVEESRGGQYPDSYKDISHNPCIASDLYDFSHPHRGYAIIIVNKYFEMLFPRNGAEVDVQKTRLVLRKLGYRIKNIERQNLDKESTLAILHDARDADHSKMDSFAIFISSHGDEIKNPRNGKKEHAIYCSDDQYIFTGDILEMFSDDNCPSLKGKPKLFFIQACRGTNVDSGVEIGITINAGKKLLKDRDEHNSRFRSHHDGKSDEEMVESVMSSKSESKPTRGCDQSVDDTDTRDCVDVSENKPIVHCNNDCLVMYGIPSGHFAWRSNYDGSWMLHYLWEEVMNYDYQKPCSFLKVLTAVNRKMAGRETHVPDNPEKTGKKAISVIIHQLDKDIIFQQKDIDYVGCTIARNGIP